MRQRLRWSGLPLQARLTLLASAVVALLLWGGGVVLLRDSRATLRRSLDTQVSAAANVVAAQLRSGTPPEAVVVRAGGPFPPPSVEVRNVDGRLLATAVPELSLRFGTGFPGLQESEPAVSIDPPARPPPPPPHSPPLDRLLGAAGWSVERVHVERAGTDYVVYAASPYGVVGTVLEPTEDRLRLAVPAGGLVAGLLAHLLAGRALRPVEVIRAEAEAVTSASLTRRVPEPPTDDEVGRLARTFNLMLGRLEASQTRQHQFVSDASHELRSPVAVLRSSLELAATHPHSTDWQATVDDLLAVTGRLERLVDDLLLLARLGEPGAQPDADDVDLDDLVREEARARPSPPVVVGAVTPLRVRGSRRDLARVVANLVDNATRWCTSTVRLSLLAGEGTALLRVEDDGPGVPEADRERVFERFVRLDPGRDRNAGGAGLGLAVVREAVEAHGGNVAVARSDLGGAAFTVALPVAQP